MASEIVTIKVKSSTLWLLRRRYGERLGAKALVKRAIMTIEIEEAKKLVVEMNKSTKEAENAKSVRSAQAVV